jgi:hypothetical protein
MKKKLPKLKYIADNKMTINKVKRQNQLSRNVFEICISDQEFVLKLCEELLEVNN